MATRGRGGPSLQEPHLRSGPPRPRVTRHDAGGPDRQHQGGGGRLSRALGGSGGAPPVPPLLPPAGPPVSPSSGPRPPALPAAAPSSRGPGPRPPGDP